MPNDDNNARESSGGKMLNWITLLAGSLGSLTAQFLPTINISSRKRPFKSFAGYWMSAKREKQSKANENTYLKPKEIIKISRRARWDHGRKKTKNVHSKSLSRSLSSDRWAQGFLIGLSFSIFFPSLSRREVIPLISSSCGWARSAKAIFC